MTLRIRSFDAAPGAPSTPTPARAKPAAPGTHSLPKTKGVFVAQTGQRTPVEILDVQLRYVVRMQGVEGEVILQDYEFEADPSTDVSAAAKEATIG